MLPPHLKRGFGAADEEREGDHHMEKRYYNAEDLRGSLEALEGRFGMSSAEFFEAYCHDDDARLRDVPRFFRHVWVSFYQDWKRLSGDDFAASVERELELA